jgi:hypothetical protein
MCIYLHALYERAPATDESRRRMLASTAPNRLIPRASFAPGRLAVTCSKHEISFLREAGKRFP